jgi:hypothetical protein
LMGQSEIVLLVSSDPGLPHCISPQHDGWQYLVFTWPKWTVYPASSLLLSSHRRSQLEPQSHTIVAKTRPAKTAQGSQRLTAFRQSLGCVRILYQAHRAQAANPTDCQTLDQDRNTVSIAHLPCTGGGGGGSLVVPIGCTTSPASKSTAHGWCCVSLSTAPFGSHWLVLCWITLSTAHFVPALRCSPQTATPSSPPPHGYPSHQPCVTYCTSSHFGLC